MVYTSYYWNYHSCNLGLDVKGDLYFMEKIYVYMVCTDYHVEEYGGFLDSHFFFLVEKGWYKYIYYQIYLYTVPVLRAKYTRMRIMHYCGLVNQIAKKPLIFSVLIIGRNRNSMKRFYRSYGDE